MKRDKKGKKIRRNACTYYYWKHVEKPVRVTKSKDVNTPVIMTDACQ
jgi:hypothetical protein